jgi:hypothetical protein
MSNFEQFDSSYEPMRGSQFWLQPPFRWPWAEQMKRRLKAGGSQNWRPHEASVQLMFTYSCSKKY